MLRLAFEPIVMGAARRRVRTLILALGVQLTRDEMVDGGCEDVVVMKER